MSDFGYCIKNGVDKAFGLRYDIISQTCRFIWCVSGCIHFIYINFGANIRKMVELMAIKNLADGKVAANIKRLLLLLIACLVCNGGIYAQSRASQTDDSDETTETPYDEKLLRTITPVAPTAASLGRYGDHPVDLSTGLVPIEIPLYEIVSGDLRVPIKLKYHSGGIKVKQEASWVGLGWDLDFGGSITRTVNGFPDEAETSETPDVVELFGKMDSCNGNPSKHSETTRDCYNWARSNRPWNSFRPDIFNYSIGEYSGNIFLNGDTVVPVSYSPIKGFLDLGVGEKRELISPEGARYLFDKSETTMLTSAYIKQPEYVSTFYVKEIVSANNTDTISYTYQDSGRFRSSSGSAYAGVSVTTERTDLSMLGGGDSDGTPPVLGSPVLIQHDGSPIYVADVKTVKPQYVYFRGGRLVFNLSGRLDISPPDIYTTIKKLDNIVVEKKENGQYKVLKKFLFHYSYFNDNDSVAGNKAAELYRLCLDSVTEQGFANLEGLVELRLVAKFEYNNKNNLPGKKSYKMDFWGYYNGAPNGDLIPRTDMSSYGKKNYIVGSADRTPKEEFLKCGSLKNITYPTKGKTEFEWEINRINREKSLFEGYKIRQDQQLLHIVATPPDSLKCNSRGELLPPIETYGLRWSTILTYSETFTSHISQKASLEYTVRRKVDTNMSHNKYDTCMIYLNDRQVFFDPHVKREFTETQNVDLEAGKVYNLSVMVNCGNYEEVRCTLTYDAYNPDEDQDKYNRPFTGLRIKRLVQTDKDGKAISTREYEYTDSLGRSSGFLTTTDDLSSIKKSGICTTARYGNILYREKITTYVASSELDRGPSESEFSYKTVREKVYGKDNNLEAYTVYDFSAPRDLYAAYNVPVVSQAHLRGKLLRKREFDCASAAPRLVRDTRNFYSVDERISYSKKGFVMNYMYEFSDISLLYDYMADKGRYENIRDLFIPSNYTYTSDWQHLDSTVVAEYGVGNERMRSKTFYTYGSAVHLQPTETVAAVGDCRTITRNAYAPDFNDSVSLRMKSANMLLYPVHEKTYTKDGSSGEVLSGGVQNKYAVDGNGNIVLSEVSEFLKDGSLCRLYSYKYNNGGRIVEETGRDNIPTAVHWDADLMQPLVVARGMTGVNLEKAVAGGYSPLTLYKKPQCTNAEVTAFTHSPLVGVTSVTRPDGYTLRYTYDGLGRLARVYDDNGHAISEYRYNYGKETK